MRKGWIIAGAAVAVAAAAAAVLLWPQSSFSAQQLGIETVYSTSDRNQNGVDDYTDLLHGAKQDAQNRPVYSDAYYPGGYPPEDVGVCTDVVWRAFRQAGYALRDMVDRDIQTRPLAYPHVMQRDRNIDFRRVRNLRVFFDTYATLLTTDTAQVEQWQPGDIVIFGNNTHIGIVSDKRTRTGRPYILHNGGQRHREEDYLAHASVTAHYRFDAALIPEEVLVSWVTE